MKKEEFYIGWQDEASSSYKSARKKFFLWLILVLMICSGGYLFVEKKFISSYFDYGNLTELGGTVVEYPVFGLKTVVDGDQVTVPLIGFGKFDADPVMAELKSRINQQGFSNFNIVLRGTLIQYNGKSWMELTEGLKSIASINKAEKSVRQDITTLANQSLTGEIVDPKCFFGVMNPAYGKIHKSCAIRCISGGMPPVLAIKENGRYTDYYFLLDENGDEVNNNVLPHVGELVNVNGMVEYVDDWKVMKLATDQLTSAISYRYDATITMCN